MSQGDYVVDNGSGITVRTDINAQFAAIATNNAGSTAPSTTFANEWWFDTTTSILKQRDNVNTSWINVGRKNSEGWIPYYGGALAGGVASVTHSSGNYTPVYTSGTFQDVAVEAAMSILPPGTTGIATGVAVFMTLQFTIDATGGYGILWDAGFNVIGLIPTVPNAAFDVSTYTIFTIDGGTTWNLLGDADPTDLTLLTFAADDDLIPIIDVSDSNIEKVIEADRLRNKPKAILNVPSASGTETPDFDQYNAYRYNLAGALQIAEPDNPPPTGTHGILEFSLEADGTNDATWWGTVNWGDALGPPDMTAETDGQVTRAQVETWDGGTTYFAYLLQQGFTFDVGGRSTILGPTAVGTATSDPVVEATGASTLVAIIATGSGNDTLAAGDGASTILGPTASGSGTAN